MIHKRNWIDFTSYVLKFNYGTLNWIKELTYFQKCLLISACI